jgi:RNA ligase (TIGR02306 family)
MRKLASIRTIESVHPIEGADKIEMVMIDGWQVVSQKGNFKPGDKCVYFEIDSAFEKDSVVGLSLPLDKVTRVHTEDKGFIEGFRIKTIKLRGQISQGYALPLGYFRSFKGVNLDAEDLTFELNVLKYDKPEPIGGVGSAPAAGNFPTDYINKTISEIIEQNPSSITIEDINVKGMMKNHNLAKSIQELSVGKFFRILDYKADWYGKSIVKINRWFPSSKLCSCCGYKNKNLKSCARSLFTGDYCRSYSQVYHDGMGRRWTLYVTQASI